MKAGHNIRTTKRNNNGIKGESKNLLGQTLGSLEAVSVHIDNITYKNYLTSSNPHPDTLFLQLLAYHLEVMTGKNIQSFYLTFILASIQACPTASRGSDAGVRSCIQSWQRSRRGEGGEDGAAPL